MKKSFRFCCLLSITYCLLSFAEAPDTLWTRTYGGSSREDGYSVQQTSDGGYIIAGYTESHGAGGKSVYLIKTNIQGDTLWTRTYGGILDDWARSVQQTTDGGYIVVGTYVHPHSRSVYLLRLNSNGDTLWTRYHGIGVNANYGNFVQQTSDSGYVIVGYANPAGSQDDVYFIKTADNGDTLLTQCYGGSDNEIGWSVQQTADGGYVIVGQTRSFGAGEDDVYLIKTDASGDTLWTKTYGGSGSDIGNSVKQTLDGGYIIAGQTTSFGSGEWDIYLIKTDPNGDTLWTKTYGGSNTDLAESVDLTSDGGYIVCGTAIRYGRMVHLLKIDSGGDTLWTKNIEINCSGHSVQQTSDGGYVVTGSIKPQGSTWRDVYLVKLKPDQWIEEEQNKRLNLVEVPEFVYGNTLRLSGVKGHGEIKMFDVLGAEVLDQEITHHNSFVKFGDLSAGVYFYSISTQSQSQVGKLVLLK